MSKFFCLFGQQKLIHSFSLYFIKNSAMFSVKEKQNESNNKLESNHKQTELSFSKKRSRDEKDKKFHNLRQIYTSHPINWTQSISTFLTQLQNNHNTYSLLLTLFEMAQFPLWRNKVPHICTLIQKLHNQCADKGGNFLAELTQIQNYHQRLCRIFYLNDNTLQEHFKLLLMIFLSYNYKFGIFDEKQIALGLIHAGRHRSDGKITEYLWIISQLQVDQRTLAKILKYGSQMILQHQRTENVQSLLSQTLIPISTIFANFVCYEQDCFVLSQLIQNVNFQQILMYSLTQTLNPDLNKEALLLCNNLLAKSQELAMIILSSQQIINAVSFISGQEQQIFKQLAQQRKGETNNKG